jgi:hypothetical protein
MHRLTVATPRPACIAMRHSGQRCRRSRSSSSCCCAVNARVLQESREVRSAYLAAPSVLNRASHLKPVRLLTPAASLAVHTDQPPTRLALQIQMPILATRVQLTCARCSEQRYDDPVWQLTKAR